jgi:phosphoribosyl 1,2-cyclic phosphate phosphodiesterase
MGEILFLGTGNSMGIPVIGCHCPVCTSIDPNNKRLRTAAVVTMGEKRFLIDAGPDLRQQALKFRVEDIDGLLLTHPHYDHIGGLDELRVYFFRHKKPLPCLLSEFTHGELKQRHAYLFREPGHKKTVPAQFDFQVLPGERGVVDFCGAEVGYTTFSQGGIPVNGYRFGDLAYLSDICDYDEQIFDDLKGVKKLVLSALRHKPSPLHLTVDEAVAFGRRVGAEETWFVHMAHDLDHEKTNQQIPEGFQLAYDGLTLNF